MASGSVDPLGTGLDAFDASLPPGRRLSIALISDFSYPRMGGVEMHQYYLAQVCLSGAESLPHCFRRSC